MESLERFRTGADRVLDAIWSAPTSGPRGLAALGARIGLLLAAFVAVDRWLARVSLLPEEAYFRPVVFAEWVRALGAAQLLLVVGAIGVLALVGRRRLWKGWAALENGPTLRLFVGLVATLLAWWFATLDSNPYFGQDHLIDRLLLVVCACLLLWKPIFALPFLCILLPFNAQFNYPLDNHSVAQLSLPAHILVLFGAGHLVWVASGRRTMAGFVFLVLCLIATSYFVPGLGKVLLGWPWHRHVYLMLFSSYSVGWLGFLEPASMTALGDVMAVLDLPVVIATLIIECGALLLLWRRGTALAWLGGFVALNTAIWLTSGILFWTWIAINAAMLALLWRRAELPVFQVFGRHHFLLSLPIILAGSIVFRPVRLAWLDAPINYTYQLEATTAGGERIRLSTAMLAPYDTHFALGNFGSLADRPQLGIVWGAAGDFDTAAALLEARTPDDVFALERALGVNAYDPEVAARFDRFVTALAARLADGWTGRTPFSPLRAPRQVWTFQPDAVPAWPAGEVIASVAVYQVLSFFDGERYRVIRRAPVREIPIEALQGPGGG